MNIRNRAQSSGARTSWKLVLGRRWPSFVVTAVALVLVAPGGASSGPLAAWSPSAEPAMVRALLDLSGWSDLQGVLPSESVPMHLPVPGPAADLGPGTRLIIERPDGPVGCTANFIWAGTDGRTYLGAAGHCFLPDGKTATHGPAADYDPALTTVFGCVADCWFGGSTDPISGPGSLVQLGAVAYARQTQGGVDVGNDFGLVEIPSSLSAYVRPSMPVWGGPTTTETLSVGEIVCHYGNGVVVGEAFPTMARIGIGVDSNTPGAFRSLTTGTFGDSGSAVEVCVPDEGGLHGRGAVGILTHISIATSSQTDDGAGDPTPSPDSPRVPGLPKTGINAGTTVARAISMATQAGLTISLVTGT